MTSLQIPLNVSAYRSLCDDLGTRRICFRFKFLQRINCYSLSRRRIDRFHGKEFKLRAVAGRMFCFIGSNGRESIFRREERQKKRVVLARVNQGSGFNGGGGGGDDGNTARILGNLALAIGLTYLSMTGQLGWVLDAIVSIWLLAVLLPIVGLGAFLWWAGRDIVQDSCPNCGNDFQIFKSSLKDGLQLCPFCSQPFSVEGNEFVREPTRFSSNQSTTFGQAFSGFSPRSKTENGSSVTVVDVEAEVKDVD
ncbi:uncharacterized protein LOC122060939 [Macadamia integrifolia]|uniref:uncharacterized protein LOC122060939 n=1 Tax=Macadamia integrifolia TaxID=60698 RepID=UPI001C53136E|nr:uncharacterized protein LOC122060939 [Macadamia integrifolia]XP_042479986.1 uncharacterized protein LOC122060939 [Macadamia integrifolia]